MHEAESSSARQEYDPALLAECRCPWPALPIIYQADTGKQSYDSSGGSTQFVALGSCPASQTALRGDPGLVASWTCSPVDHFPRKIAMESADLADCVSAVDIMALY
jgi:hypothetical protein